MIVFYLLLKIATIAIVVVVTAVNQNKMGGISAKAYQQRLQPMLSITTLQNLSEVEIRKEEQAIKGLKEQDFLEGDIYGNGTEASYRSKNYEIYKSRLNPLAGGAVDLIVTGQFVDAMYLLKQKQGKYMFGNTDRKRNILKEMYGENIFGLNQNVFSKFQKDIIAPRFIRAIKEQAKIG